MAFLPANGTRLDPAFQATVILANSVTFAVGEAVETASTGFGTHAAAAKPLLGIIIGFKNSDGSLITPATNTKSTTSYTGTVESVTTASDNQTNAMVKAIVTCDTTTKWSAQVNGTIGTTNVSNLPGGLIDVDSANSNWGRVLESTNTRTSGTPAGFYDWGTDPNDSTRLIVSIAESELNSART